MRSQRFSELPLHDVTIGPNRTFATNWPFFLRSTEFDKYNQDGKQSSANSISQISLQGIAEVEAKHVVFKAGDNLDLRSA